MPEKMSETREQKWGKFIPLAERRIKEGDFKTAIRILEGYKDSVKNTDIELSGVEVRYKGKIIRDALSFCYERIGELNKAASRYEEIGAPFSAARAYERIGNYKKAERFYNETIELYSGNKPSGPHSWINDPKMVRTAEEGLRRVEEAEKRRRGKLENKIAAVIGIAGFLFSIVFLSNNFTGNIIGQSAATAFIGAVCFVFGMIGAFWYFKSRQ